MSPRTEAAKSRKQDLNPDKLVPTGLAALATELAKFDARERVPSYRKSINDKAKAIIQGRLDWPPGLYAWKEVRERCGFENPWDKKNNPEPSLRAEVQGHPNRKRASNGEPTAKSHDVSWFDWPYCLDRQPDGTWLPLNRAYKPLGVSSREWVDYTSHPSRVRLDGLSLPIMRQIAIDPICDEVPSRVYLYDDATTPRRSPELLEAYLEVLVILQHNGLELPLAREPEAEPPTEFERNLREAARARPRSYWRARPQWKDRFQ